MTLRMALRLVRAQSASLAAGKFSEFQVPIREEECLSSKLLGHLAAGIPVKAGTAGTQAEAWRLGVTIKPPGDRRLLSMFPLTRVPTIGVPIFDPQPCRFL